MIRMFDQGAMPVLERVVQFTQQRHAVLAGNVANLSTPYYQPRDLDPRSFQQALGEAIDRKRAGPNPHSGPLSLTDTRQLRFQGGRIEVQPDPAGHGILYHDQNNRDLERTMQHLAENTLTHNSAIELMKGGYATLAMAIRERI